MIFIIYFRDRIYKPGYRSKSRRREERDERREERDERREESPVKGLKMSPLSPGQDEILTRSHILKHQDPNLDTGHGSRMHFTYPEYTRGFRLPDLTPECIPGSMIQDPNHKDTSSRVQERNNHSHNKRQGKFHLIYLHYFSFKTPECLIVVKALL